MRRLQRQTKTGETLANVRKSGEFAAAVPTFLSFIETEEFVDGRPRFEFNHPSIAKATQPDHDKQCTCLPSLDRHAIEHRRSPVPHAHVPHFSLDKPSPSSTRYPRETIPDSLAPPKPPVTTESNVVPMLPIDTIHPASAALATDAIIDDLPDDHYAFINDLLQSLSTDMNDPPSDELLLEIESSLAQRIYDCVVEQEDDDDDGNEIETKSHSTTTGPSSALSVQAPALNHPVPPSPLSTNVQESAGHREKCTRTAVSLSSAMIDHLRLA